MISERNPDKLAKLQACIFPFPWQEHPCSLSSWPQGWDTRKRRKEAFHIAEASKGSIIFLFSVDYIYVFQIYYLPILTIYSSYFYPIKFQMCYPSISYFLTLTVLQFYIIRSVVSLILWSSSTRLSFLLLSVFIHECQVFIKSVSLQTLPCHIHSSSITKNYCTLGMQMHN